MRLSDFLELTVTILKSYSEKPEPKKRLYRDFKNFSKKEFSTKLVKELNENNVDASQLQLFPSIFLGHLKKMSPTK